MAGLDSSFAAAMLVGYHAGTHSTKGVRAHTYSSSSLTAVRIDGELCSEGNISCRYAHSLGVPIIMASGDDAFGAEMIASNNNDCEIAVTKDALSFHSANCASHILRTGPMFV
eukprot:SAG31_NODE_4007_length_3670_cov_1.628955_2_plen_113_part_00